MHKAREIHRDTTGQASIFHQVKSTATEIERKIFHLCGLLVRQIDIKWHICGTFSDSLWIIHE